MVREELDSLMDQAFKMARLAKAMVGSFNKKHLDILRGGSDIIGVGNGDHGIISP